MLCSSIVGIFSFAADAAGSVLNKGRVPSLQQLPELWQKVVEIFLDDRQPVAGS